MTPRLSNGDTGGAFKGKTVHATGDSRKGNACDAVLIRKHQAVPIT